MPRRPALIEVEKIGGDRYPNLETVQRLALMPIAGELARVVRSLLESGALVVHEGKIIINPAQERVNHEGLL